MALEPDIVESWLYSTLRALPALAGVGVHNTIATASPSDPVGDQYVVFQLQGGTERRGVGTARVWSDLVYLVKVVSKATSYTGSKVLRSAIAGALDGARGAIVGGQVIACVSERPVRYVEIVNGVHYRHAGETWRIYAKEA